MLVGWISDFGLGFGLFSFLATGDRFKHISTLRYTTIESKTVASLC